MPGRMPGRVVSRLRKGGMRLSGRLIVSVLRRVGALAGAGLMLSSSAVAGPAGTAAQAVTFHPAIATDYDLVSTDLGAPTQTQCAAARRPRRCFAPAAIHAAYNLNPLYQQHLDGAGVTIAVVDAFGSDSIRHDLNVFNTAFNLQHMCGEADHVCAPGDPTFSILSQGVSSADATANGHQEDRSAWALEVSLDVEWAHAVAPKANILLVTTPTAETLGVQGFPDFMKAEKDVIDGHLASVITQSFASAEEAFNSTQSLENLRYAFKAAVDKRVTVFGSSGDSGTANVTKSPVAAGGTLIPFPTVQWPASDPLVTGVGGTNLCVDGNTGLGVNPIPPPAACAGVTQRENVWVGSGGGFSHVFGKPAFQNTLPAGSTPIGSMRGVPDVAYNASPRTGVLIYDSGSGGGGSNVRIPGWYVIGGTSASSPQWAGIAAIATQRSRQLYGHDLGYINPALYAIASNPARYAADFFDVTRGSNQTDPTVPGYRASTGWDPDTGLGTPNAANLVPDLVAATK